MWIPLYMRTHTGEKPFKCKECNFAWTVASILKTHVRTHTGEKRFKCSKCDLAFAQADNLKQHITRTYTGEKQFKCEWCNYACAVANSLKTHMRTQTGEKHIKCTKCDLAFAQPGNRKHPITKTHTGENRLTWKMWYVSNAVNVDSLFAHVITSNDTYFKCQDQWNYRTPSILNPKIQKILLWKY